MPDKVKAIGHISVVLVVDMNQFLVTTIDQTNEHRFERLRGTDRFANVLHDDWWQKMKSVPDFTPSARSADVDNGQPQMNTDETAYVMGIFRHNMLTTYSGPEYRLNLDKRGRDFPKQLRDNYQFRKLFLPIWKRWDIYIRPTMTGMFVIRLVRSYEKMRELHYMAKDVIDLQQSFDIQGALEQYTKLPQRDDLSPTEKKYQTESVDLLLDWLRADKNDGSQVSYIPVQWQLALEVCHRFFEAVGWQIDTHKEGNGTIQLGKSQSSVAEQQHDSFTIYHFDAIYTRFSSKEAHKVQEHYWRVSPIEVKANGLSPAREFVKGEVRQRMVNLLEGAILRKNLGRAPQPGEVPRYFPLHEGQVIDDLLSNNMATWQDEICLLTSSTGIIMPSQRARQDQLYISTLPATPTTSVRYVDYWQAMERMFEFISEVRVLAQLLERQSLEISQHFVDTLREIRTEMLQGDLRIQAHELTELVEETANLIRLVALCQSLSTPHVWSRAEYAISKADHLLDVMRISRLVQHAERNVSSLTRFVDHIDELYLAEQAERNNESTNRLSTVLGFLSLSVILFSLPSFWRDSQELDSPIIQQILNPQLISVIALLGSAFAIVLGLFSVVFLIRIMLQRRRRRSFQAKGVFSKQVLRELDSTRRK